MMSLPFISNLSALFLLLSTFINVFYALPPGFLGTLASDRVVEINRPRGGGLRIMRLSSGSGSSISAMNRGSSSGSLNGLNTPSGTSPIDNSQVESWEMGHKKVQKLSDRESSTNLNENAINLEKISGYLIDEDPSAEAEEVAESSDHHYNDLSLKQHDPLDEENCGLENRCYPPPVLEGSNQESTYDRIIKMENAQDLMKTAFFQTAFQMPAINPAQRVQSLQQLANLRLTQTELKRVFDTVSNYLVQQPFLKVEWDQVFMFKNMISQALFYYTIFGNPIFSSAITNLNSGQVHLDIKNLQFVITSITFLSKLAHDIENLQAKGIRDVILSLETKYRLPSFNSEENFLSRSNPSSASQSVSQSASYSSFPQLEQEAQKFLNFKTVLKSAEHTDVVFNSGLDLAESTKKATALNSVDVSLDIINGASGFIHIVEKFNSQARSYLESQPIVLVLSGASLVLTFTKAIMTGYQDIILDVYLGVKAVEVVEAWQKYASIHSQPPKLDENGKLLMDTQRDDEVDHK